MSSYYEKFLVTGEVKCIDEEILFEIPKNWCWVRLGDILTVKGGKRIPLGDTFAPTPTAHIYIRVTEMKNHTLVDTNLKYISDAVYEKIKNYTISKNDLYLTIAGTIGSVGVVPEKFDGMNLTENAVKSTTSTAIHVGSGCTLTIEGVNGIADKLKAEGGKNDGTALGSGNAGAGIGSSNGGNIVISNVTIEATGSTWNHFVSGQYGGGAAIGSTVPGYCGDITITDAVVNATGGYMAAAIGMGGSIPDSYDPDLKIGKIDIRNSVITAKGGDGASAIGFASMSSASLSSAYAGEIYIEMTETSSAFLNRLTISNGNYKIGKGYYYYYYTGRMTFYNQDGSGTWPGVTLKASDGTQTSPDGIGQ